MCLYYVEVIPFRVQRVQNAFVLYEMTNLVLLLVLENCYFAKIVEGSPLRVFNIWQIGISTVFWVALQQIHWRSGRESQYKPGSVNPEEEGTRKHAYPRNEKKPADWVNNLTETENEFVASSVDKGQPKSIMRQPLQLRDHRQIEDPRQTEDLRQPEDLRQLEDLRPPEERPPPRRTSQFVLPPSIHTSRMARNHPYFEEQRSPTRKLTQNNIPMNYRLPPDPRRRPNFPPFGDKTRMMNNMPDGYPPEYSDSY